MSNLINQNWIGFDGKPITGRVPPNMRLMAGQMTPTVMAEVAHRYQLFCMGKQTAVGDYFVSNKTLPGGGHVRIVSIQGVDTVFVWAPPVEDDELMIAGGFVSRPTSRIKGALTNPTFWGKPFTEALEPLGTPGGEKPFVLLRPKWGKDGGVAKPTHQYKRVRGLDNTYGPIDWQGPKPKTDVLSWDASGWDYLSFDALNNPVVDGSRWQEVGYTSPTSPQDPDKPENFVPRYRCKGSGTRIYWNMTVLRTMVHSGVVDGAAKNGKDLIVVMRTGSTFTFVRVPPGGSTEDALGSYTMPDKTINTQCWYFNQDGTKARCVFASKSAQYAIEATLSGGAFTFAEIAGSRGDAGSGPLYQATVFLDYEGTSSYGGVPFVSYDNTFTGSWTWRLGNISGAIELKSPAIGADFVSNAPVIVHLVERAVLPAVSGSASATQSDSGALGGPPPLAGLTQYNSSLSATTGGAGVKVSLLFDVAGEAKAFPLAVMDTSFSTKKTYSGSVSYTNDNVSGKSGTISLTVTTSSTMQDGARVAHLLDFDARTASYVVYAEEASDASSATTSGTLDSSGTVFNVTNTSGAYAPKFEWGVKTVSGEQSVETVAREEIFTYGPGGPSPGGQVSGMNGPFNRVIGAVGSDVGEGSDTITETSYFMDRRTLADWRAMTWSAQKDAHGVLRTYYGNVLSTSVIEAGGAFDAGPYPLPQANMSAIHIIGPADTNGAKLVHIEDKPIPWLFRLGVV